MNNEPVLTTGASATLGTARSLLDRARALAARSPAVTVDCAELIHCDAAGLQVLLALRNTLGARGGRLRVVNVPSELAWRFDYAGLAYSTS